MPPNAPQPQPPPQITAAQQGRTLARWNANTNDTSQPDALGFTGHPNRDPRRWAERVQAAELPRVPDRKRLAAPQRGAGVEGMDTELFEEVVQVLGGPCLG